jgi:2-dehydropantoate 2-reductase
VAMLILSRVAWRTVRITIIGAGAIGGITGAYMARAGADVTLVDQAEEHVNAIRRDGLHIDGINNFTVHLPVLLPSELRGPLDLAIIAVKTQHTAPAIDLVQPHLTPDSIVMPLQNGISGVWISEALGQARTVLSSITTNNFFTSPGHLTYNQKGTVHVGEWAGSMTPRVESIVALLRHAYDAHASDNVWGWIWSKMVAGSITFTTALVDAPMGPVLTKSDRHRRMFGAATRETGVVRAGVGGQCAGHSRWGGGEQRRSVRRRYRIVRAGRHAGGSVWAHAPARRGGAAVRVQDEHFEAT